MGKRDFFWRHLPPTMRKQLRMDEVASFSVTEFESADRITRCLVDACRVPARTATVIDGMACVGGNVLSFAPAFARVIANELDASRCEMLAHNVQVVLGEGSNVTVTNESILTHAQLSDGDVLFLDPEWGGPGYAQKLRLRLTIGSEGVEDFVKRTLDVCPRVHVVGLKLPCNYDIDFVKAFAEREGLTFALHTNLRRMILIVLTRAPPSAAAASASASAAGEGGAPAVPTEQRTE